MCQPGYEKYGFKEHIGILPGWDWLAQHEHDLDNWQPELEIIRPGSHYTIKSQDIKTINKAIKIK